MNKLWEVTYKDGKTHVTEYHWGVTRMEPRGAIVRRLKREVKFISVIVVDENHKAVSA